MSTRTTTYNLQLSAPELALMREAAGVVSALKDHEGDAAAADALKRLHDRIGDLAAAPDGQSESETATGQLRSGSVSNTITGTVGGNVVQTRDAGNVTL